MDQQVIDFIRSKGPVTDLDLASFFGILEYPDLVFPIFRAVRKGLAEGSITRIHPTDPVNGNRLVVGRATNAAA